MILLFLGTGRQYAEYRDFDSALHIDFDQSFSAPGRDINIMTLLATGAGLLESWSDDATVD